MKTLERLATQRPAWFGLIISLMVLACYVATSILAEVGYLSNFEEETLLNQETFRAQIALGIFQGLVAFYNTKAP